MTQIDTPQDQTAVRGTNAQGVLDAVVHLSDDAIVLCDLEARVISWGGSAERLFGQPSQDVLEHSVRDLFPDHLQTEVVDLISTVHAGDRIRHFETEIQRPDGMSSPVSLSLCPIAGDGGDIVGSLMLAHDITEQHLTQATLAEVESRVEEAEALAHVGSWLWDMRTGVVQWSAEFHRIHGAEPLEFDGTMESYLAFVHPDDHDQILKAMETSLTSGQSFEVEYRLIRTASPDDVHVLLRGRPMFGSDGAAIGQRGVGQEISPIESKGMSLSSNRPEF